MIAVAPPPPPPGGASNPANARWNWRRMSLFANVFLGRSLNNTDGAFSMPATGRIEDDWGPANFDIAAAVQRRAGAASSCGTSTSI